ncbi:hypothetical protein ACKAMS_26610 [Rhodococcus sp. 5A-K4]|uniref:hypothetical protein n=1 Tax=Rhodococcus sp. 5A-K4 TaxID=3384442 RepID=UPI002AA50023
MPETDTARTWVLERTRYPQRSARTTAVLDWSAVSPSTQSAVAALSTTIVDPNELLAPPSWWRALTGKPRGYAQLTTEQREELRQAYSALHWPLLEEGTETRLVVIAENLVARIISNPAWAHPLLDGHRSVLGFTIELHMIAAAAHELLRLRSTTPTLPADDGTDQLAKARAEWDRRHVVAARVEAALVDRVAALRAYEQALTPIAAALNNLQSVTELAAGAADVDRIFGQIIGSDYAAGHTTAMREDIDDVRAGLEAQVAYLDSLIGPHRNA